MSISQHPDSKVKYFGQFTEIITIDTQAKSGYQHPTRELAHELNDTTALEEWRTRRGNGHATNLLVTMRQECYYARFARAEACANQPRGNAKLYATGVVFIDQIAGVFRSVAVKKEVIIPLGALQSLQLLMVSRCASLFVKKPFALEGT